MKPEDLLKLDAPIRKLISQVFFQGNEPTWLSPLVNGVFLLVFALLAIWGLLLVLGQIKKIWLVVQGVSLGAIKFKQPKPSPDTSIERASP